MMVGVSVKRVVSVFVLRPGDDRVALFRRRATMPTFPGHW